MPQGPAHATQLHCKGDKAGTIGLISHSCGLRKVTCQCAAEILLWFGFPANCLLQLLASVNLHATARSSVSKNNTRPRISEHLRLKEGRQCARPQGRPKDGNPGHRVSIALPQVGDRLPICHLHAHAYGPWSCERPFTVEMYGAGGSDMHFLRAEAYKLGQAWRRPWGEAKHHTDICHPAMGLVMAARSPPAPH